MAQQLVVEQLIDEARQTTSLERFDSESYREGLDILIADFNALNCPDSGVGRMRAQVLAALTNRLKITDYLEYVWMNDERWGQMGGR